MFALTKKLVQETHATAHPAAKAGFGLLTIAVLLATVAWLTLYVFGLVAFEVLRAFGKVAVGIVQQAQKRIDDPASRAQFCDSLVLEDHRSLSLPDGLPPFEYRNDDPRHSWPQDDDDD